MLKTPELAKPRSRKVTTVCNGKREVWNDYEEAKAYFLELMMSTDGEKHERAECIYISSCTDWRSAAMRTNNQQTKEKAHQRRLSLRSGKLAA